MNLAYIVQFKLQSFAIKSVKTLEEFLLKDKHIEWTEAEAPVSRLVKCPSIHKRIRSVNPPPQEEEKPHPRDSLEGTSFRLLPTVLKRLGHLCTGPVWWSLRLFFFCTRTVGDMRRLGGGGDELAKQHQQQSWEEDLSLHLSRKGKNQRGKKERRPEKASECGHVAVLCGSCVLVLASVKCVRYES